MQVMTVVYSAYRTRHVDEGPDESASWAYVLRFDAKEGGFPEALYTTVIT